jgi:hypothetical protein
MSLMLKQRLCHQGVRTPESARGSFCSIRPRKDRVCALVSLWPSLVVLPFLAPLVTCLVRYHRLCEDSLLISTILLVQFPVVVNCSTHKNFLIVSHCGVVCETITDSRCT